MYSILGILLVLISQMDSLILTDILWDPRNLMFNQKKCSSRSRKFYAKLNDELNIVCANPDFNIGIDTSQRKHKSKLFYNVFYTEIESVYRTRNGTSPDSIMVHKCEVHEVSLGAGFFTAAVYKKQILFGLYPLGVFRGFRQGRKYWFFTTSDGTKASLDNEVGDENSMGFELEICLSSSECKARERNEVCLKDEAVQQLSNDLPSPIMQDNAPLSEKLNKDESGTPSNLKSSLSPSEKEENPSPGFSKDILMISTVMALVLGILLGVLVMLVKGVCMKKQGYKPTSTTTSDYPKKEEQNTTNEKFKMHGDGEAAV